MLARDINYSTPETARRDSYNQKIPFKVLNKLNLFFCPINTDYMREKFNELAVSVKQESLKPIALIRPDNIIWLKDNNFNLPTMPDDHYHLLPEYDLDNYVYRQKVDYAKAATFIHEALTKGYHTYLQVQLMNDASATIVAAYLIRYQHYNADQAKNAVKRACAHTEFSKSQEDFLHDYAKQSRKLEGKINDADKERAPIQLEESKKSPSRRDILIAFAIAAVITLAVLTISIAAISFAQPHLVPLAITWGINAFGSTAASATLLAVATIAVAAIVGGVAALARYLFKRDKSPKNIALTDQDSDMVSAISTHADVQADLRARPPVAKPAVAPAVDEPVIALPAAKPKKKKIPREPLDQAPSPRR